MKKNVIVVFLLFLSLGFSIALNAQGTKKKKKKKQTTQTAQIDSVATTPSQQSKDSMAAAMAKRMPTPPDGVLDTGHMDFLVADTSTPPSAEVSLDSTRPVDGNYKIPLLRGARPFAFPKENRNNIKFYKRFWRHIDLTDSVNQIFCMPGETLIMTILNAIQKGTIIAYKDEKFTSRLTYAQALKAISPGDSETIMLQDINGQDSASYTIKHDFNPDSVQKYEIKEDVYFDKTRGRLYTTLVGIAPIKKLKTTTGVFIGDQRAFWLYFPQCRNVFAGKEIYDTQRELYNISIDDIFIQRAFRSNIVKESSSLDLYIKDIPDSKGGLKFDTEEKQKAEGKRIEEDLRKFKKDIWKH